MKIGLLVARPYAPRTDVNDVSKVFVWIDIKDGEWSDRCDEGMTASVIEVDGVFYVTATYTTPSEDIGTMFYHLYSDNGTTVFSDIQSKCKTSALQAASQP